jgi:hypothetical protein
MSSDRSTSGEGSLAPSEMIDAIINEFDFDRVHRIMRLLRWKYGDENLELKTPSKKDIIDAAYRVMKGAVRSGFCACGGFEATYEEGFLTLKFVPVSGEYEHYPDGGWGVVC